MSVYTLAIVDYGGRGRHEALYADGRLIAQVREVSS